MTGCTLCGGWAGRHDPIAHDAEPQEDTMTEPTDELRAFVLGLVDRPGVPPAVARELADSITAWAEQHARERAADAWSEGYWAYPVDGSNPYADDRPDPGRC